MTRNFYLKGLLLKISLVVTGLSIVSSLFAQQSWNQTDAQGRKQGPWRKMEGQVLLYEGQFKDDKPYDTFRYYYPDGKQKAVTKFSDQGLTANSRLFHPNGKLMAEGRYINQQKDGKWDYYNEKEILVATEFYKEGVKHGSWITYYDNGQVSEEIPWENGQRQGIWKQYYPDGQLKSRAIYQDDRLEGLAQFYYPSGRSMMSGTYLNSLKEGEWIVFSEDGGTLQREIYDKGYLIKSEEVKEAEKIKVMREDEEGNQYMPGRKPKYELKDPE